MIESVQARHRGAFNFEDHYDNLCALQDSAPLPAVKAHLGQGILDINGDRIRLTDWQPIVNSIRINKSLQFIALRSYYQVPVVEDEKRAAVLRRKLPAIRSKEITHRLVKALKECLCVSPTLACIELQGLALRDRDLQVLMKGILKSHTLQHLSLECCRIGDLGLEVLCKGLKNSKYINSVNLSGCSLTPRGAESLAAVIKHQGMQRHNEAWQDSLRYRRPDLDRMSGIRRITANNNPLLGDDGARLLADTLKDDLWLKALDLQGCGIGVLGAKSFLEVLKYNTTMVVLDLRRNPLIGRDILHSVMEQLMLNSNGEDQEYAWLKVEDLENQASKQLVKTRRKATRVLNSSRGKKTTIKSSGGNNSSSCRIQITPASGRRKVRARGTLIRKSEIQPSPGLPWRTAARANRFRGHPPDTSKFLNNKCDDDDDDDDHVSTSAYMPDNSNIDNSNSNSIYPGFDTAASTRMKHVTAEAASANEKLERSHMSLDLSNQKVVLSELEHMRRILTEERLARARSDQQVINLTIENRKLMEENTLLRKGHRTTGGAPQDDSFLDHVEASFSQFHNFMDLLRDIGLGQLLTMAGLDHIKMPFSNRSTNMNNNFRHSAPTLANDNGNNFRHSAPALANNNSNNNLRQSALTLSSGNKFSAAPTGNGVYAGRLHNTASIQEQAGQFDFANIRQKRANGVMDVPVSLSSSSLPMFAMRQAANPAVESAVYDTESEIARQEADELFTRLMKESRVALGQQRPDEANTGAASSMKTGLAPDKGHHGITEAGRHLTEQNGSKESSRPVILDPNEDSREVQGGGEFTADDSKNLEELLSYASEEDQRKEPSIPRDAGLSYEFEDSKDDDDF